MEEDPCDSGAQKCIPRIGEALRYAPRLLVECTHHATELREYGSTFLRIERIPDLTGGNPVDLGEDEIGPSFDAALRKDLRDRYPGDRSEGVAFGSIVHEPEGTKELDDCPAHLVYHVAPQYLPYRPS